MPPKPGSQTIAVHVLVNMSRSKCNQTMKFDQLIEYNMKNIEILKLSCRPFAFTSYKTFWKNKKRSRTSLSASFSTWFWRAIFFLLGGAPNSITFSIGPSVRLCPSVRPSSTISEKLQFLVHIGKWWYLEPFFIFFYFYFSGC